MAFKTCDLIESNCIFLVGPPPFWKCGSLGQIGFATSSALLELRWCGVGQWSSRAGPAQHGLRRGQSGSVRLPGRAHSLEDPARSTLLSPQHGRHHSSAHRLRLDIGRLRQRIHATGQFYFKFNSIQSVEENSALIQ